MNPEKAIEVQNDLLCWQEIKPYPDVQDAIKLGIEALKAWKALRDNPGASFDTLLPGETEE